MECKSLLSVDIWLPSMIKVEPYWNVNPSIPLITLCAALIKVEPYWNVNFPTGNITFKLEVKLK